MTIKRLEYAFSVCQVEDYSQVDWKSEFCFIGQTDEERSLVCLTRCVPSNTLKREDGWQAFRIEGTLDFSLIGILARISTVLAQSGIGIFAVSTYNTDYVLVKAQSYEQSLAALESAGYTIAD